MWRSGAIALLAASAGITGLLQARDPQPRALDMVPVAMEGGTLNVSRFEVTIAEWNDCVSAGACEDIAPRHAAAARTPMTGVNWFDAEAYVRWASTAHRRQFRLPTAEEWRAFSGLAEPVAKKPLFDDPRLAWAAQYGQEDSPGGPVRPQGSGKPTQHGLQDVEGNVWEWTSSCVQPGLAGAGDDNRCPAMKAMGAHTAIIPVFVRDTAAGGCSSGKPPAHLGFRIVEEVAGPVS
jgi:formylglycine-generating enzyme required for sulfatase activity